MKKYESENVERRMSSKMRKREKMKIKEDKYAY
jgi:hypothetical protein